MQQPPSWVDRERAQRVYERYLGKTAATIEVTEEAADRARAWLAAP